MLSSEKGVFINEEEIKKVAKEVVKRLGYYIKIVDWNKKETLKAKIKMAVKEILIETLDERIEYERIDKIASEIYEHAEMIFTLIVFTIL